MELVRFYQTLRLGGSTSYPRLFIRSGQQWSRTACVRWLQDEKEYLHLLLLAAHLTSGMPARATEIGSLKHCNSSFVRRSIYLYKGSLSAWITTPRLAL